MDCLSFIGLSTWVVSSLTDHKSIPSLRQTNRPRYLSISGKNPSASKIWILKQAMFGMDNLDRPPIKSEKEQDDAIADHHSQDGAPMYSSAEAHEWNNSPAPNTPPPNTSSHHDRTSTTSATSVSTITSVGNNTEDMSEVMERTKRRLEKYKAARLMTKKPSSTSLQGIHESDDLSASLSMMSPITRAQKRLQLKLRAEGSERSDDEPPLPVPELFSETSTQSNSGNRGRHSSVSLLASIRMDGAIVSGSDDNASTADTLEDSERY